MEKKERKDSTSSSTFSLGSDRDGIQNSSSSSHHHHHNEFLEERKKKQNKNLAEVHNRPIPSVTSEHINNVIRDWEKSVPKLYKYPVSQLEVIVTRKTGEVQLLNGKRKKGRSKRTSQGSNSISSTISTDFEENHFLPTPPSLSSLSSEVSLKSEDKEEEFKIDGVARENSEKLEKQFLIAEDEDDNFKVEKVKNATETNDSLKNEVVIFSELNECSSCVVLKNDISLLESELSLVIKNNSTLKEKCNNLIRENNDLKQNISSLNRMLKYFKSEEKLIALKMEGLNNVLFKSNYEASTGFSTISALINKCSRESTLESENLDDSIQQIQNKLEILNNNTKISP